MSLRTYLISLAVSSALCWGAFVLTVINTNPGQGQTALLSFYISLSVALLGTLTLIGYAVRRYSSRNELKYSLVKTAFRQGLLVAAGLLAFLLLQSARLADWWDILLIVVILSLMELYLRAYDRPAGIR